MARASSTIAPSGTYRLLGFLVRHAGAGSPPLTRARGSARPVRPRRGVAGGRHEYLARSDGAEQVLFIGRAQEKMTIFRTERRRNPTTGVAYPWIVPATAMVNQFYIYALDADFGPFYGRNTPWPLPPILPPAPAAHVHGDGGSAGPGVRLGPAVAQQTDDREVHR